MRRTIFAGMLAALALAAPAAAIGFPPVPTSEAHLTSVQLATGRGFVGRSGFTLSQQRVTYGSFRSTAVQSVLFGRNAVKLRGVGIVDGRRVPFTAIAVDDAAAGVDVFRISWNHAASLGGRVTSGLVFVG